MNAIHIPRLRFILDMCALSIFFLLYKSFIRQTNGHHYYLNKLLVETSPNLQRRCSWNEDELIKFGCQKVKGQGQKDIVNFEGHGFSGQAYHLTVRCRGSPVTIL